MKTNLAPAPGGPAPDDDAQAPLNCAPVSSPAFADPSAICRWIDSAMAEPKVIDYISFVCDRASPGEMLCLVDVCAGSVAAALGQLGGTPFGYNGVALRLPVAPEFRCHSRLGSDLKKRHCSCCPDRQGPDAPSLAGAEME